MRIVLELEIGLVGDARKKSDGTTQATFSVRSTLAGTEPEHHYGCVVQFPRGEPGAAEGALHDAIRHFVNEARQELAIKP